MNAHSLRTMFSRRSFVPLTILFLFSVVVVCGFVASRAQSDSKEEREVVDKIPKHLPIKIKIKKEKEEKVKDLKNEDWLGELELEVTNTGTKPIYYLDIDLFMPDVFSPNGLNIGCRLTYGRGELISFSEPLRPDDMPIKPGEVAVLKVLPILADGWKRGRAKGEYTNPKKIEFLFLQINFGDGTGYATTGGSPIPERKERSANSTCAGGDSAGDVGSVKDPPRYHFPDLASLVFFLPQPVSLTPAFFIPEGYLSEPNAAQDLCCSSGCSRLIGTTDQGCPCPGVTRRVVQHTSCSDPQGSCGTVRFQKMPKCTADGEVFECEESFIEPTCVAPTPTPTPPPCTPPDTRPAFCCEPEAFTFGSQQFCSWNCDNCGTGTVFPDGCVKVSGPVVCDDGYVYDAQRWGGACCPQQTSGIEGYGGTASCDIELPPSCMDGIDNDGDHYVDGNDPAAYAPRPSSSIPRATAST